MNKTNHNLHFLVVSLLSSLAIGGVITINTISKGGNYKNLIQADDSYSFTINSDDVTSSSFIKTTSSGGSVNFTTNNVNVSNSSIVISEDGYILNNYTTSTYHNAITKVSGVTVSYSGDDLYLDYTWGEALESNYYRRSDNLLTSEVTYDLSSLNPNFIKVKSYGTSTITSIRIDYLCSGLDLSEPADDVFITSKNEFVSFLSSSDTYEGKYVYLTSDINMTDATKSLKTSAFKGYFDGLGHTISNLTISRSANSTALFTSTNGASIKNLEFDNVSVRQSDSDGISIYSTVVGTATSTSLYNINVNSGEVYAYQRVGGIVGECSSNVSIINCSNSASITSFKSHYAGGIVADILAKSNSTIKIDGCTNNGIVSNAANYTGGIVGYSALTSDTAYLTISNCVNNGVISGTSYVGGILGGSAPTYEAGSLITKCTNNGSITGTSGNVGGLVGALRINISDSYCLGSVTLTSNSTSILASAASEVGTPGYVTSSKSTSSIISNCGRI